MPLNKKGSKIMSAMTSEYGPEKGERVFYASRNKGTISGVEGKGRKKGGGRVHVGKAQGGAARKRADR